MDPGVEFMGEFWRALNIKYSARVKVDNYTQSASQFYGRAHALDY